MESLQIYQQLSAYAAKTLSALDDYLHKVLKPEDADRVITFIEQHQKNIITGFGILSVYILGKVLFKFGNSGTGNSKRVKKKRRKHHKHKHKTETRAKIDPIEISRHQINTAMNEFDTEFLPKLNTLLSRVEEREDAICGPDAESNKKLLIKAASERSYKDAFQYQRLYFNEQLLKLIMRLDSIDTQGQINLRNTRKQGIKRIQGALDRLDSYKSRMQSLIDQKIIA